MKSTISVLAMFVLCMAFSQTTVASTNLIQNPSLEVAGSNGDPQGWFRGGWGTNTRSFTYPAIGYEGAKAAKVEITAYTSGDAKWYFQEVAVTPGQQYTFSSSYISSVPSFISVRYKMANGTFTYLDLPLQAASPAAWKHVQGTFTAPSNVVSLTVFHVIKQVGYLTTDNFSLTTGDVPPPSPSVNLIPNPTFEIIGANGDPVGWFRGGYGQNTRSHAVGPCTTPYTEANLLLSLGGASESGAVFRPACPPNATRILSVSIGNYINGDAKWYFADVPISANKNFRVTYQYQDYTRTNRSQAVARYAFPDGSYQYSPIGAEMIDHKPGGMGYVGWVYVENDFTAPADAISMTIFFSTFGDSLSGPLSISNVVLRQRGVSELPAVGADLTGPTAAITSPIAGATVSGTTTVSVSASDNVSVGAVRVYANRIQGVSDGVPIGPPDSTFPYSFEWDTTAVADGSHTLTVVVVDKWGSNVSVSSSTTVTVANIAPPPSPTNLIQNPSLETAGAGGDPANWVRAGWGTNNRVFTYPVSGKEGSKAARVAMTSRIDGDAKWRFADVPVTGGQSLTLAHSYRSNVSTDLTARYTMNNGSFQYVGLGRIASSTSWASRSNTFVVPANAKSVTVMNILFSVGWLEVDAFSLTPSTP